MTVLKRTYSLEESTVRLLEALNKVTRVSMTQVINQSVEQYFSTLPPEIQNKVVELLEPTVQNS